MLLSDEDAQQFARLITVTETGDAVVLQVERNGELTYLAFDME